MKKPAMVLVLVVVACAGCERSRRVDRVIELEDAGSLPPIAEVAAETEAEPDVTAAPVAMTSPQAGSIEARVGELLAQMTLEEKVGQMTQITLEVVKGTEEDGYFKCDPKKLFDAVLDHHVGSILNCGGQARTLKNWREIITNIQYVATEKTRLRIPVIYGIDTIHGANYTLGATIFPQNIAMAATGNRDLMRDLGAVAAFETRASGIPWNFNPVLDLARDPRWPRFYETFGEDPYLASVLGAAYIEGQQGDDIGHPTKVAACMKHYLGYSVPASGMDRTPAYIPDTQLRQIFLKPFAAAVEAGVATVMVNSSEINGVPVHASRRLLTDVLRGELGFEGFVVSDWADIENLYTREKVARDRREAVRMAVMAGIDMSMVPYDFSFYETLLALVNEGQVPVSRIDEAVSRILRVKFRLGLFERPYPDTTLWSGVAIASSTAMNLQAATEAMTLLKNDANTLPLSKDLKVLVTGPTANKLSVLNGGWTITWQGDREDLYPAEKLTVFEAIVEKCGPNNVAYIPGVDFEEDINAAEAFDVAERADVVIACMGEPTYCETPGNIHDLTLPPIQRAFIRRLAEAGKPVVLVLVQGRPRVIRDVADRPAAILMAYLPGMEGGRAVADVLFGDANPGGKLPFTYPRYAGYHTTYDHKPSEEAAPNKFDPQWPFGFGLSYTTFTYGDIVLDRTEMTADDVLTVGVEVANTGAVAGKETVQLFLSDLVASVTPAVRRLAGFERIALEPGQSQTVTFRLDRRALEFIGADGRPTLEPGMFRIAVGGKTAEFELK